MFTLQRAECGLLPTLTLPLRAPRSAVQKPLLPLGLNSTELELYGSTPELLYPAQAQIVQPPLPLGKHCT